MFFRYPLKSTVKTFVKGDRLDICDYQTVKFCKIWFEGINSVKMYWKLTICLWLQIHFCFFYSYLMAQLFSIFLIEIDDIWASGPPNRKLLSLPNAILTSEGNVDSSRENSYLKAPWKYCINDHFKLVLFRPITRVKIKQY